MGGQRKRAQALTVAPPDVEDKSEPVIERPLPTTPILTAAERRVIKKPIQFDTDSITGRVVKEIKAIYAQVIDARSKNNPDVDEIDLMAQIVAAVAEGWTVDEAMDVPVAHLRDITEQIMDIIRGAPDIPKANAPQSSTRRSPTQLAASRSGRRR